MPGAKLHINLAPPLELNDGHTEDYHERLLQDTCAAFLPMIGTLVVSTYDLERAMKESTELWQNDG